MDKEKKVYEVFQNISEDYDKMNDIISLKQHRKWKGNLIRKISAQKYTSILDICCGTGDISLLLAQKNPQAQIYGLDFSENMLAVAQRRKQNGHHTNVQFCQGNAMQLPYADQLFDCTTISFGLRNVPDYEQVLREMYRILKPGGMLYCLDSSYPTSPIIKPFFKLYFKFIMPGFGKFFAHHKKEYQWLNDSTEQFLSKKELAALLEKVGFQQVGYHSYLFGAAALHYGKK